MAGAAIIALAAGAGAGGASVLGTSLLVGTALGGLAGAQLAISRDKTKLDIATINANKEQAKLQASESALQNAQSFRKALASQVALANFRGGQGSSLARQFGSESFANFAADQRAIERGVQQINTAATLQRAGARSAGAGRALGIIGNTAGQALSIANFSKTSGG